MLLRESAGTKTRRISQVATNRLLTAFEEVIWAYPKIAGPLQFQMETAPRKRKTTPKRSPLWVFEKVGTIRKRLISRAGRLTLPGGRLTLTISGGPLVEKEYRFLLAALATPT